MDEISPNETTIWITGVVGMDKFWLELPAEESLGRVGSC